MFTKDVRIRVKGKKIIPESNMFNRAAHFTKNTIKGGRPANVRINKIKVDIVIFIPPSVIPKWDRLLVKK
jgi:hypothetical protein